MGRHGGVLNGLRMASDKSYSDPANWPMLFARAQDGDRVAYRTVLVAITPWLRAIARHRLRDASEAEDAVQDILLTVHHARHSYDPARPIKPWLAALAQARIVDRQRVLMRRAARETSLDIKIAAGDETFAAPITNQDGGMDGRALRRAIAALSPGQRTAIELVKMQEMSMHDAAIASGQSVGALKVAVHRALIRLRTLIGAPA